MKKTDVKRCLKALFHQVADEAEAVKSTFPSIYFIKVNQAIGIMRAAEALEVSIVPVDEQEPDHPDTLLPIAPLARAASTSAPSAFPSSPSV